MSLQQRILHIATAGDERDTGPFRNGWVNGRQSMRHAAAELAAPYDALVEQMAQALQTVKAYFEAPDESAFSDEQMQQLCAALAKHAEVTGK